MKLYLLKLGLGALFISLFLGLFVKNVKAEPYGWSPNVDNSWGGTPTCTDAKPDKSPILYQPNHPLFSKGLKGGEVKLLWTRVPGATGYSIFYGLSPKNYIYSAADIGNTNTFTVSHLANKVYYFMVQSKNGCASSGPSREWAARPGKGGFLPGVTGFTPIVKKTTAYVPNTTTTYLPSTVLPTTVPEVKGVSNETAQEIIYQPPVQETYQPPQIPSPTKAPKPLSWWQTILKMFGLSK